ncbi:MAG: hypothetical protein EOP49_31495 [Sphingobacteriales bacterium]|nr:MAG: hypothetical protein EOP49_31495 [Sphingobacteriales bacterium]
MRTKSDNHKKHWLLRLALAALAALPATLAQGQTYCTPLYSTGCTEGDQINLFSFNSINNPTTVCNPGGYTDYTNLSTTVIPGQSYPLTVQSGQAYAQGFSVWIDYNQNGSFSDAGENVWISNSWGTAPFTGSVTIPLTATSGATRLRVRSTYNGFPTDACAALIYGEAEDYTVIIGSLTPCTGAPSAGTTPATVTACFGSGVTINAAGATTGSGITYQWQQSADGGVTWVNATAGQGYNSETYFTPALSPSTNGYMYRLQVTCSNSGLSATSSVTTVIAATTLQCYCSSGASFSSDEDILNVTFAGINNTSACNGLAGGPGSVAGKYANYTGLAPAAVMQGQTIPLSVTSGSCGAMHAPR